METLINGIKINYERLGQGKRTILLLHGWGGSLASLLPLGKRLESSGFKVFLIDLPGFGQSGLPLTPYSLDNYSRLVEDFIEKEIKGATSLFGHSFGGSVALKVSARRKAKISALILCGSAGIRRPNSPRLKFFRFITGAGKFVFNLPFLKLFFSPVRKFYYYHIVGERDYIDSDELRQTFQNVIGEDLSPLFKIISIPTLIIWGSSDRQTPLSFAKKMTKEIPHTKLKIIKGVGHALPKEKPDLITNEISKFVE